MDLRSIGGTSRSPDLSLRVAKSTSIASSDSEFVRGSSAVLINRPGEGGSSSSSLGLPDSAVHLLVADLVKSSRSNISVSVDVLSIHRVPGSGNLSSREFRKLEASDGSSSGLNLEGRSSGSS